MSWLSSLSVTVVTYVYCRCMALEGLPGWGLWEGPCIPYFLHWSCNIGTFLNINSANKQYCYNGSTPSSPLPLFCLTQSQLLVSDGVLLSY